MSENRFPSGVISYGWEKAKQNWRAFVPVWILMVVVYGIDFVAKLENNPFDFSEGFLLVESIVVAVLGIILTLGLARIGLNIVDGKSFQFEDLFSEISKFWRYLGAAILTGLAAMVGFILLVVPGIIVSMRLQLTMYYIVDQNQGPIEAMKSSWAATKGQVISLLAYFIKAGVMTFVCFIPIYFGVILVVSENSIGYIFALLGLLVVLPVTAFWVIGVPYIYRSLNKTVVQPAEPSTPVVIQ